ncbi:MAG: hypothetical protein JJU15_12585 [Pararhodobacter sp.]|nr:hypothetical protein [Pararhodobacter sp.]
MVGPSKILTVSYGTFSCTLEGFDEPFSTMKAIAEYFRDLAAEDRYFGAEPPTPDAEMLHRIAEREIKRRVDARIEDNGVTLRPRIEGPAESWETEGQPTTSAVTSAQPYETPATEPDSAFVAPAVQPAAPPAHTVASPDIASIAGISDKLQRIRAAVAQARAFESSEDESAPPVPAPSRAEAERAEAERLAAEEAERAEAERLAAEEAERAEAERLAAEEAEHAEAERLAAEEAERAEAERLAAEEAERAEAERLAAEEAERAEAERLAAEEAEHAEAERLAAEEAERAEAERLAAEEAERTEAERLAAEEAERTEAERLAAEEAERTEAERLAAEEAERTEAERLAAEEAERLAAEEAERAEAERLAAEEAAKAPEPDARPRRRVVVVHNDTPPARQDDTLASEAAEQPAEPSEQVTAATALAPEITPEEITPELAITPQTDAEAEAESDGEDESLEVRVARALGQTGLPAEAEAELLRELVAVEREAEDMRAGDTRRRELLEQTETEEAVDRLISQADSQLQQPEAQRRQSTISHLKAAVAATRADAAEGNQRDDQAEAKDLARYRDDLARTVRPSADDTDTMLRRPQRPSAAARTERPRTEQPPLVLVSEQRIDRPAATETVRPRRVSAGSLAMEELFDEDDAPQTAQSTPGRAYIDFIAPHNLSTLTEMIEAAAAYVTHVEGCPEFTRPQVMRHVVATGMQMTSNRENLLRAFGLLLRQGLIRRSRRGQFELMQESDFAGLARRFAQRG